jgi:HEAT repeat protein
VEREKLAYLLDRVADGDEQANRELLDYIMQQPEGIRVLAFEALEQGGDDTYDQLMLTLADDPSLVVRSRRAPAAAPQTPDEQQIPQPSGAKEAPPDLLATLQRGARAPRIQATRALGQYSDPKTIAALVDAVQSGDRMVAAAAVEALQEIGGAAVPSLVEALNAAKDSQVRWSLVKTLSTIGDERAVPGLIQALQDANYGTRWLAAEGLARVGQPTLVPLLRRLADEKSSAWLKESAWHVLNKIRLRDAEERAYYKQFGAEIKRTSAANIPHLVRQELRRLGHDA